MTPEQYLEFEAASPRKHEYVAGDVFAMPEVSLRHNTISINLAVAFHNHLRGHPDSAYATQVKVSIRVGRDQFFYYPDVMVAGAPGDMDSQYVEDPKLVVEVLSPSTERMDRHEKAMIYRQLPSLEEYVLVAQDTPEVLASRRSEEWLVRHFKNLDEVVEFRSIDLSLPLSQIYEGVNEL